MRRLLRKSWAEAIGVLVFGAVTNAFADSAVILGAGQVGGWTTTVYVANPNSVAASLLIGDIPYPCFAPVFCRTTPIVVPPLGSASLTSFFTGDFDTFYVSNQPSAGATFPVVHASLVNRSTNPARSVDIPIALVSQLIAVDPSSLNFGGVVQEPPPPCAYPIVCFAPHSTLVLGNIRWITNVPGDDFTATLELFDSDGNRVGSASLTVPYGETALIGDVVAFVGAGPLSLGQLRVTRTSGRGLMWGIVYTTAVDGAVSASAGVNLSP